MINMSVKSIRSGNIWQPFCCRLSCATTSTTTSSSRMTANETSEERKARLSALRKRRQSPQVPTVAPQKDVEKPQNDDILEDPKPEIVSEAPRLEIAKDDTVEALSGSIQHKILSAARQEANQLIENEQKQENDKPKYTEDLRSDIEPYLREAELRTNKAIYQIIQEKYEASSSNE